MDDRTNKTNCENHLLVDIRIYIRPSNDKLHYMMMLRRFTLCFFPSKTVDTICVCLLNEAKYCNLIVLNFNCLIKYLVITVRLCYKYCPFYGATGLYRSLLVDKPKLISDLIPGVKERVKV